MMSFLGIENHLLLSTNILQFRQMDGSVNVFVSFGVKLFATKFTRKRLLSRVNAHVLDQGRRKWERLSTHWARLVVQAIWCNILI